MAPSLSNLSKGFRASSRNLGVDWNLGRSVCRRVLCPCLVDHPYGRPTYPNTQSPLSPSLTGMYPHDPLPDSGSSTPGFNHHLAYPYIPPTSLSPNPPTWNITPLVPILFSNRRRPGGVPTTDPFAPNSVSTSRTRAGDLSVPLNHVPIPNSPEPSFHRPM